MTRLPAVPADGAFFFDFDGTLADIAPRPDEVCIDPRVPAALQALRERSSGALAVISGRPVAEIDHYLQPLQLPAAGQHGAERRDIEGRWHRIEVPRYDAIRPALDALVRSNPGLILETKSSALALHFRAAPHLAEACREAMRRAQDAVPATTLLEGKQVIELKPAAVDKGNAMTQFMQEPPFTGRQAWFFGDDVTDEAAFAVVQRIGGVAVKVGSGETIAQWRLADPDALRDWLYEVVAA